jgi:hypothetical protein
MIFYLDVGSNAWSSSILLKMEYFNILKYPYDMCPRIVYMLFLIFSQFFHVCIVDFLI